MTRRIVIEPLSAAAFAPFGDLIETEGVVPQVINDGYAHRFDGLATLDFALDGGKPCLSIFRAKARALPLAIRMLERHPLGSQAFMPLSGHAYLVVVAPADNRAAFEGVRAFHAKPGHGVNYRRGVWHHPLLALHSDDQFLVIDRRGPGNNLEEAFFPDIELVSPEPLGVPVR